jgi:hypothetical protein
VGLRRDDRELAVVAAAWPTDNYPLSMGDGVRFERFAYVEASTHSSTNCGGRTR